ncbi:hypothetical protein KZX47_12640 [Thermus sp. SYSU G05001]|uniref:Uncharacterized protein n=1 Tax=Thermus brevis TaxID=2862456 RepID=A0ABS7A112_9DEIN|nr:hypothetical protein [Thermus brevis]MBW6395991.1 hypothetical protein [Thermus brevis]
MEIADAYKILVDRGVPTEDVVRHGSIAYERGTLAAIRQVAPQVQVFALPGEGYLVQGPGGVTRVRKITRLLGVVAAVAGGDYAGVVTALAEAAEREILRELEARIRIYGGGDDGTVDERD